MPTWTTVVELESFNLKAAFERAKEQAYQEFYRWDFTIQLLSTTMIVDGNGDEAETTHFHYAFQVIKT